MAQLAVARFLKSLSVSVGPFRESSSESVPFSNAEEKQMTTMAIVIIETTGK